MALAAILNLIALAAIACGISALMIIQAKIIRGLPFPAMLPAIVPVVESAIICAPEIACVADLSIELRLTRGAAPMVSGLLTT